MNKQVTRHFLFISFFTLLLASCSTLRKESPNSTARHNKSGNTSQRSHTSRTAASRPPAKKPVSSSSTYRKSSSTIPSKSVYTKPAASYNADVPKVVQVARTYSGTPYRSGGNDKNGIDCSGLICSVYSEIGVKVPRISWQQSEFGAEVSSLQDIKPGDWVFFVPEAGKEGYVSHAGIVTDVRSQEEIMFIHASTSKGVREDNLFSTYFKGRFVKAMRPFKL